MNLDRAFSAPATLLELARYNARQVGDEIAYHFVHCDEQPGQLTYQQVDGAARRIAAQLQQAGLDQAPVLLLLPTGPGFVSAFFGCQYAGVPAVPVAIPRTTGQLDGLHAILQRCGTRTIISHSGLLEQLHRRQGFSERLGAIQWLLLDQLEADADSWRPVSITAESIAVLQFTSGSTGRPKGVMVSQRGILANQALIEQGFQHAADAVVVGWLPLFHDMGLVGNMLNPFYLRRPCVLMPPQVFLRHPRVWLETISEYAATTSGGPDFAYALCLQRIGEELDDLDLSHWRVAFTGAEPVRAATLRRFAQKFAPAGFSPAAFYPCYGLAEATLIVTGADRSAARPAAVQAVSELAVNTADGPSAWHDSVPCGVPLGGQRVVVVDPHTHEPCEAGQNGEVWIAGACVASGYYADDAATRQVFQARLTNPGEHLPGPYLRTGDIGVYLAGQLCLRGRLKNIIIINGMNIFAEDIEAWLDGCASDLVPGAIAAFPLQLQGQEALAVVAEVRRERRRHIDGAALAGQLRARLADYTEVPLSGVILCNTGTIPRTTSGKLQHWQCAELFATAATEVPVLFRSVLEPTAPVGDQEADDIAAGQPVAAAGAGLSPGCDAVRIASWLRQRIAAVSGQSAAEIPGSAAFAQLGITSSDALEVTAELSAALQLSLDDTLFWEYPNIDAVADYLHSRSNSAAQARPGSD